MVSLEKSSSNTVDSGVSTVLSDSSVRARTQPSESAARSNRFSRIIDYVVEDGWDTVANMSEYVATAVLVGGLLIAAADENLNTRVADNLATVQVKPHSNQMYQLLEKSAHDIGIKAQDIEHQYGGHIKLG